MRRYEISEPRWTRSPASCRTVLITGQADLPSRIFDRSSMASSGSSIPAPHGVTSRNVTVPGTRSSGASTGGGRTALWAVSSPRCWTNWTTKGRSITTSGVWITSWSRASKAAAGAKKNASSPQQLGGPKTAQMQEPSDHALGRSRGGFGTKIHLVCDSHGSIVAIHLTAGQTHESKVFEPTMARRLFLRRRGQSRWPRRVAADKGYSYATDHPAVVSAAADRSRHSHASQPATEQALQQGHLSAATHRRAGRGLVQRVSCPGHSLPELRSQLCCLMAGGHHGQGPPSAIPKHSVVDTSTSLAVYV